MKTMKMSICGFIQLSERIKLVEEMSVPALLPFLANIFGLDFKNNMIYWMIQKNSINLKISKKSNLHLAPQLDKQRNFIIFIVYSSRNYS